MYNLLLECGFPPLPLLAESKLLRQKAQNTGLWQCVSHSFVYVWAWGRPFKKEFFFLAGGSMLGPE